MQHTYKAIELPAINTNIIKSMLGLRLVEKPLPEIGEQQLLVKMEAASCNPSDIAFLQGTYNVKKTIPCVPGFEGAGVIVACGSTLKSKEWIGKRVSCFTQRDKDGTWAEYFLADKNEVIVVGDQLDAQQAATFFINPFTAWGLFDIALERESKAIIINAAGSQVAAFMVALAAKHGIKTIGIVRKAETATMLANHGFDALLVSTGEDFAAQLKAIAWELEATTAYDAVGGEATGQLVNCLPPDSEVVVYGGLSAKAAAEISIMQLIFNNVIITGFNLNDWIELADAEEFVEVKEALIDLIRSKTVYTRVQLEVPVTDVVKGLRTYITSMSAGKMLIRF